MGVEIILTNELTMYLINLKYINHALFSISKSRLLSRIEYI